MNIILSILLFVSAPALSQQKANVEKIKAEIMQVEKEFQDDLNRTGIAEAFYKYAAEDAVIRRENDTIISGRKAIRNYYAKSTKPHSAEWNPDYIGVSEDGTMAYTYGRYKFGIKDKDGNIKYIEGGIHTVWRRQKDGTWKYVWD